MNRDFVVMNHFASRAIPVKCTGKSDFEGYQVDGAGKRAPTDRCTCTYAHICTYAHMHICTYAHMHICTYAHTPAHQHICTSAHLCTHAHIHTYTHTHMRIRPWTQLLHHRRVKPQVEHRTQAVCDLLRLLAVEPLHGQSGVCCSRHLLACSRVCALALICTPRVLYPHLHCTHTSTVPTPPLHPHLHCTHTSTAPTPPLHPHLHCTLTSTAPPLHLHTHS